MLRARKKNRVIRIPDEKVGEYKKLGYTITDENGNKVYEPEDKDATIASLKLENARLRQRIEELNLLLAENQPEDAEKAAQEPKQPDAEEQPAAEDDGKTGKETGDKAKEKTPAAKSK